MHGSEKILYFGEDDYKPSIPVTRILSKLVENHDVEYIVVGDGSGCREAYRMVKYCIDEGYFSSDVKCIIGSERGASIYSESAEAQEEFPGLDTRFISAISIARRMQDPMVELVKYPPENLGVGSYQHSMDGPELIRGISTVTELIVSEFGVDVNRASRDLLKFVSMLFGAVFIITPLSCFCFLSQALQIAFFCTQFSKFLS